MLRSWLCQSNTITPLYFLVFDNQSWCPCASALHMLDRNTWRPESQILWVYVCSTLLHQICCLHAGQAGHHPHASLAHPLPRNQHQVETQPEQQLLIDTQTFCQEGFFFLPHKPSSLNTSLPPAHHARMCTFFSRDLSHACVPIVTHSLGEAKALRRVWLVLSRHSSACYKPWPG